MNEGVKGDGTIGFELGGDCAHGGLQAFVRFEGLGELPQLETDGRAGGDAQYVGRLALSLCSVLNISYETGGY